AAQVALEAVSDFLVGRSRRVSKEFVAGQDHARRTEPTLQAVLVPECFPQRMQLAILAETLDRCDRAVVRLNRQAGARANGDAVEQPGAGSALAGVAAALGAGHATEIADEVDEEQPRLALPPVRAAVDRNADWHPHRITSHSRQLGRQVS